AALAAHVPEDQHARDDDGPADLRDALGRPELLEAQHGHATGDEGRAPRQAIPEKELPAAHRRATPPGWAIIAVPSPCPPCHDFAMHALVLAAVIGSQAVPYSTIDRNQILKVVKKHR